MATTAESPYRTRRAQDFRESCAWYLAAVTGRPITWRPIFIGRAESIRAGIEPVSRINGLPSFSIMTRVDHRTNLASAVSAAVDAAEQDGRPYGVSLWAKGGASVPEGYAVTDVATFARMAAALDAAAP